MKKSSGFIPLSDLVKNIKDKAIQKVLIPTNVLPIDNALGGGLELGSIVQLVGESGTGKTTIALNIARELCKKNYKILYLDAENSISKEMLISMNMQEYENNLEEGSGGIYIEKVSNFKDVEKTIDSYIKTNEIKFVFVDSLASLINDCYININGDSISVVNNNTNNESRPLGMFVNKYSALANMYNVCFIYINQFRNKIDIKNKVSPTVLKEYGVKSVRYSSDIIIRINKLNSSNINSALIEIVPGTKIELEILKSNKLRPHIKFNCYLEYGKGINEQMTLIDSLITRGKIVQNQSYFTLEVDGKEYTAHGMVELYKLVLKYINCLKEEKTSCLLSAEHIDVSLSSSD